MKRSERTTARVPLVQSIFSRKVLVALYATAAVIWLVIGVMFVVRSATDRRAVADVVTDWGSNQRTVEPLRSLPGSRPILVKDPGNLARVCELSGWPQSPCAEVGLSPRVNYGIAPKLEQVYKDSQGYVVVLSYTDATDQITERWVVASLARLPNRSWYVHAFADVPLSTEPDEKQSQAILRSTRRCDPTSGADGC